MESRLISKVWHIPRLVGNAVPGVLLWDDGKVAFITEEGVAFHEPLSSLKNIKWPFLRMGFGFDVLVNGTKYKFSFSKPNHSSPDIDFTDGNPFPEVEFAGQYFFDLSSLATIKTDKATTRKWKEILGNAK